MDDPEGGSAEKTGGRSTVTGFAFAVDQFR
jgi:hypothetical protein